MYMNISVFVEESSAAALSNPPGFRKKLAAGIAAAVRGTVPSYTVEARKLAKWLSSNPKA